MLQTALEDYSTQTYGEPCRRTPPIATRTCGRPNSAERTVCRGDARVLTGSGAGRRASSGRTVPKPITVSFVAAVVCTSSARSRHQHGLVSDTIFESSKLPLPKLVSVYATLRIRPRTTPRRASDFDRTLHLGLSEQTDPTFLTAVCSSSSLPQHFVPCAACNQMSGLRKYQRSPTRRKRRNQHP